VVLPHFTVQLDDSDVFRMIPTSSGDDLQLWDAANGMLKRTFKGHTDVVDGSRFFPDGKTAVSSSDDQTLKVWESRRAAWSEHWGPHIGSWTSASLLTTHAF
jgi:WD40 repeat protein